MEIRFRPLRKWPKEATKPRDKQSARFSAPYEDTVDLLIREAEHLGAREIVIEAAFEERDIRLDGLPRANATAKADGVAIYLETRRYGPLMFATDVFGGGYVYAARRGGGRSVPGWQNNLRAIALGLESLRTVDRYGITSHGEQYTGWKEIGSGVPMGTGRAKMTVEEAARLLLDAADLGTAEEQVREVIAEDDARSFTYRMAAKRMHPDAPGGSVEAFKIVEEANRVLHEFGG